MLVRLRYPSGRGPQMLGSRSGKSAGLWKFPDHTLPATSADPYFEPTAMLDAELWAACFMTLA